VKRNLAIVLALILMCAGALAACAEAKPAERYCGRWQDPYYGRAMLTILPVEELEAPGDGLWYSVRLKWGDSARSEAVWSMLARCDEATDTLVYTDGVLAYVAYGDDGEIDSAETQWEDAEGSFALLDGKLLWTDSREERAARFAFERAPRTAPSAEECRDRYYLPVSEWAPGTAGSSLKLASLCADLADFADEYQLWDGDIPALRESLLEAWTMLDDSTRRRFDEGFPEVTALMAQAMSDYSAVAGQFEDAGAGRMALLAGDERVRRSWDMLVEHTCTMGNGE